ncbi:MAG: head decoration protein [Candidatus Thiodiazotropha sp. (ex Troendleina suluensis)]|nr:head decoration protein [Candidatus Thiodiazotropha sp. (ex Troendleina suluensis)]
MTIASSSVETYSNDNLIAGSAPIVTNDGVLASGQTLVRGAVVGRVTASGELVQCNPGAADGSEVPVGILVHPIDASAAAKNCQFYVGGEFHMNEMTWHAGFASDVAKRAAFDGTAIVIR